MVLLMGIRCMLFLSPILDIFLRIIIKVNKMKYFFLIIDYSIPLFMIFSYPWWKKIANGDINQYAGMRTTRSMENKENWKKAQLLCGKYCVRVGIVLLIFVILVRSLRLLAMEWNSVLIASINSFALLVITYYVNKQL